MSEIMPDWSNINVLVRSYNKIFWLSECHMHAQVKQLASGDTAWDDKFCTLTFYKILYRLYGNCQKRKNKYFDHPASSLGGSGGANSSILDVSSFGWGNSKAVVVNTCWASSSSTCIGSFPEKEGIPLSHTHTCALIKFSVQPYSSNLLFWNQQHSPIKSIESWNLSNTSKLVNCFSLSDYTTLKHT